MDPAFILPCTVSEFRTTLSPRRFPHDASPTMVSIHTLRFGV